MDSTGILTIMGLVVAVYAILPKENKLTLSFKLSKLDWAVILLSAVIALYIFIYPIIKESGWAISFGTWKWGFNENNTTFLVFLCLAIYIFIRVKYAGITSSNIKKFSELFEQLFFEKKYSELAILTEDHFEDLIKVEDHEPLRNRLARKIRPLNAWDKFPDKDSENFSKFSPAFSKSREAFSSFLSKKDSSSEIASSITRRVLNSREYIEYLSISKPYFCLKILELDISHFDDFLNFYIRSLVQNKASIFYYELEQTQNLVSNNRYYLYENNKFLYYFFNNIRNSEKHKIYKPVGDMVCEVIDSNDNLSNLYNKENERYERVERFLCPIDSSLRFFEIMILESMHQGAHWHMWLYYLRTFTKKILLRIDTDIDVDVHKEWPTPFYYLLDHIISIIFNWLDEFQYIENKDPLLMENDELNHDNGSIPKSSVLALGIIYNMIIMCDNVTDTFKTNMIDTAMRHLRDTKSIETYNELNTVLIKSMLFDGYHNEKNLDYLNKFKILYEKTDHVLRYDVRELEELLNESIEGLDV